MISILTWILILIFIIIILIDIIPIFSGWLSRIHIGRHSDMNKWNDLILKVSYEWLNKTPKIKVTDNTRFTILDRVEGKYSSNNIQYWQEASLLLGVKEYLKNDDYEIDSRINEFLKRKFKNDGSWVNEPKSVDSAILSYALMNINNINIDKYKLALDSTWNLIKSHIGEDGTVRYRIQMNDYRYVDTIGFICPFLIKYGLKYDKDDCIELSIKQIREFEKFGMLVNRQIPYHAYDIKTKIPLGLCGWGRGLGWYSIGLIDSWNELPNNHKYKNELTEYIKEFAKEIIEIQNENGGWNWTTTRKETRIDSSTTAILTWFLINASEINDISLECKESVDKAMKYLMSVTKRNGEIDFSQGDTKDIGVYSMLFDILPFTQGFTLRTLSLLIGEK